MPRFVVTALLPAHDAEEMQRIEVVAFYLQHGLIRALGFGEPTFSVRRHAVLQDLRELQRSLHRSCGYRKFSDIVVFARPRIGPVCGAKRAIA